MVNAQVQSYPLGSFRLWALQKPDARPSFPLPRFYSPMIPGSGDTISSVGGQSHGRWNMPGRYLSFGGEIEKPL